MELHNFRHLSSPHPGEEPILEETTDFTARMVTLKEDVETMNQNSSQLTVHQVDTLLALIQRAG